MGQPNPEELIEVLQGSGRGEQVGNLKNRYQDMVNDVRRLSEQKLIS